MFLSVSNHDNENLIKNRLNTKHVYPASKHVTYGKILISTITIIIGNQWQPFIKIKKKFNPTGKSQNPCSRTSLKCKFLENIFFVIKRNY